MIEPAATQVIQRVNISRQVSRFFDSKAAQTRAQERRALYSAWKLVEQHITKSRLDYEKMLEAWDGAKWVGSEFLRIRLVAGHAAVEERLAALIAFERSMATAKRFVVPDNIPSRGQHGPSTLPQDMVLRDLSSALRKAFVAAGNADVSKAVLHRVISKIIGNVTEDAVRKALVRAERKYNFGKK